MSPYVHAEDERGPVAYYNASVDERQVQFVTETRMCSGSPSVAR